MAVARKSLDFLGLRSFEHAQLATAARAYPTPDRAYVRCDRLPMTNACLSGFYLNEARAMTERYVFPVRYGRPSVQQMHEMKGAS